MPRRLTIAIDGPAGSGKSSVARRVAALLEYSYLDSGAMYRALALKALERKVALDDQPRLEALAKDTHIELRPPTPEWEAAGAKNRVFLDGREVTREVRTAEVAQAASQLATIAAVRRVLVDEQQRAGAGGGVVMEGRDIGTKVFPHADVKIFLDADPVVREQRRLDQQKIKEPSTCETAAHLRERDLRDRTRAVSPLVPAEDAVILDSTNMSEDEVLRRAEELVRQRLALIPN
jgi:cytidylate kinase